MNIANIKKGVLEGLEHIAKEYDFKVLKGNFSIKRKEKERDVWLGFTYNTWFDEIQLFPFAHINMLAIMNLSKQFGDCINYTAFMNIFVLKEFLDGKITEDTQWKLQYENKDRIKIFNENDIVKASEIINDGFIAYGLKYFDKYSTINAIDRMYNTNPLDNYNPNCSGYNMHCLIGLISAKLSDNQNFKEISDIYTKAVIENDFTENLKTAFFKIKNYFG